MQRIRLFCYIFLGFFIFCPILASAASLGEVVNFNVDKNFDVQGRSQVAAELVRISDNLYIYIEKDWFESQTQDKKDVILSLFDSLSQEFKNNIYPQLTLTFGTEPNPGIDNDQRITVLFHQMNSVESGYFREADEYEKIQVSYSNKREMLYLSSSLTSDLNKAKVVLGHEFTHLITFKQKNINFNVSEETWLNEARADYSSQILGYDNSYEVSPLQQRVLSFLENPSDSLTEWQGTKYDYSAVRLFTTYLVEHYGINILVDSLRSPYLGVASLNYALKKANSQDDFSQIFTNWVIASVLDDCSIGKEYCYINPNLKNLRLVPSINFLPFSGNSSLSINNVTKNWSGNWLKLIGGNGDLMINFSTTKGLNFKIPYILTDNQNHNSLNFILVDKEGKGSLTIPSFSKDYKSMILMPVLMSDTYQVDNLEANYPYTFSISTQNGSSNPEVDLIKQLLDRIASLEAEIAALHGGTVQLCQSLDKNLFYGMQNNQDVRCLQQFLKNQGSDIYPEGRITGNFGDLTRKAVIKFQEKYKDEILTPSGFSRGTGFVGANTRRKINQLMGK